MADTTFGALVKEAGLEEARALGRKGEVDKLVLDALPPGTELIHAIYYGISFWTRSLKVRVHVPERGEQTYFLKLSSADEGKIMMSGEYDSQRLLNKYAPEFIPLPVAWGCCTDGKTYFFLSDFIEMTDSIPEAVKFCERLADLHRKSMDDHESDNPSNLFGLERERCQGNVILSPLRSASWREYFQHAMDEMIDREQVTQGPCPQLERYRKPLVDKIIPRLLDPLQTDGNSIKPCLVHGDLWHGNSSVSTATGDPYAFDSCAIWAHNEYEMGIWRASRYQFKNQYFREYHRWIPISQPEEDWDMRNMLYAVRIDLLCSALYAINQTFRKLALEGIEQLIGKLGIDLDVEAEETEPAHMRAIVPASQY